MVSGWVFLRFLYCLYACAVGSFLYNGGSCSGLNCCSLNIFNGTLQVLQRGGTSEFLFEPGPSSPFYSPLICFLRQVAPTIVDEDTEARRVTQAPGCSNKAAGPGSSPDPTLDPAWPNREEPLSRLSGAFPAQDVSCHCFGSLCLLYFLCGQLCLQTVCELVELCCRRGALVLWGPLV